VLGASLLSLFLVFQINPGFWPTVIAHVLFCMSFVVVTVKARIASLDPRLEQAAMDLYANERETFRRVTLPLVAPGIAAAALLAFSLSFDDFIITNFNSGTMTTFPKFIYTSAARGIPAQANVIGSAMFFLALAIVIVGQLVTRKRKVS
jgi:spermidine/putrescine transport system permease protein